MKDTNKGQPRCRHLEVKTLSLNNNQGKNCKNYILKIFRENKTNFK